MKGEQKMFITLEEVRGEKPQNGAYLKPVKSKKRTPTKEHETKANK